jgi:hypothetical protein
MKKYLSRYLIHESSEVGVATKQRNRLSGSDVEISSNLRQKLENLFLLHR